MELMKNFSGFINFYSWGSSRPSASYKVEDGILTFKSTPKVSDDPRAAVYCSSYTVHYYNRICGGGYCTTTYHYSETFNYCIYEPPIQSDLPPDYDGGYGGGGDGGSNGGTNTYADALNDILAFDPSFILEIPCDQLPKWQGLAQHEASQTLKDKINQLEQNNGSLFDSWAIQTLNGANGTIVNMDYFSVNVTALPKNPQTNIQFTPETFLDYIRRNLNSFVETSSFTPYCNLQSICAQETNLWNSANPTGAIIYIDIPGDDGAVMCSEYTSSYWYFITLETPEADNHPVSGTRQFGFEPDGNGGYNFFVRGVDRIDSYFLQNFLTSTVGNPFLGADILWNSFQNKLSAFVNTNHGSSVKNQPVFHRVNYNKVKEVLEGSRPISDLGCN